MRISGHPIHAMLVHFPLAFWTLASACDALALFGHTQAWQAASVLTGLGVIMATMAMVPGLVDLAKLPIGAEKTGLFHMSFMGAAWIFYLIALVLHIDNGAISASPVIGGILSSFAGFACLAIGGFYGGELVYRHGAGQMIKENSSQAGTKSQ